MIYCDIETEAKPELIKEYYEFDRSSVKTGNIKDPEKIAAKINEAESEFWKTKKEKAALNPLTGEVLAIGYMIDGTVKISAQSTVMREYDLLEQFWSISFPLDNTIDTVAGWNFHEFDLPFIWKRSLKHGIKIPPQARSKKYWSHIYVDLMKEFMCHEYKGYFGISKACKFCNLDVRKGDKDIKGKDFARLYRGTKEENEKALLYLADDLRETQAMGELLGYGEPKR